MLEERLLDRVPGARFEAVVEVPGYALRFHKRSDDGSGKCNIVNTGAAEDVIYGIVFDVPDGELPMLDRAEGLNQGYDYYDFTVGPDGDGDEIDVRAYVAAADYIVEDLIPYNWYHDLVMAGAEQHRLPEEYIDELRRVQAVEDPNPNRQTKLDAERALAAYHQSRNSDKD